MTSGEIIAAILIAWFIVLPLLILAVKAAWWAFRMVFFTAILFISMAGKAWRGEL